MTLSACTPECVLEIRQQLIEDAQELRTVQDAAQGWCDLMFERFEPSLVLVRAYMTVPYGVIPESYQKFARNVATSKGWSKPLDIDMPTLCMLGTRGVDADWNDPRDSKGHLALPLIGKDFVQDIPMVTRLLNDMGVGLGWLVDRRTDVLVETLGRIAGLFYVPDARSDRDELGRHVVPDQKFVEDNQIRTVFGIGGTYVSGNFLTMICFSQEALQRLEVVKLQTLLNTFKVESMSAALGGRIFNRAIGL